MIAVSAALIIQALFFGDGGVLAIGVNCFNMAVVLPFVGYGVYCVLSRKMTLTNPRRAVAAGFGAYAGLNKARAEGGSAHVDVRTDPSADQLIDVKASGGSINVKYAKV